MTINKTACVILNRSLLRANRPKVTLHPTAAMQKKNIKPNGDMVWMINRQAKHNFSNTVHFEQTANSTKANQKVEGEDTKKERNHTPAISDDSSICPEFCGRVCG